MGKSEAEGRSRGKGAERGGVRRKQKAWEECRRLGGMWGQAEGEWARVEGKCGERRNVRGVGKAWEECRRPRGMWGQVEGEWGKAEGKCGEMGSVRVMGRVGEARGEWERVSENWE